MSADSAAGTALARSFRHAACLLRDVLEVAVWPRESL
jgi:hypothetical protein